MREYLELYNYSEYVKESLKYNKYIVRKKTIEGVFL